MTTKTYCVNDMLDYHVELVFEKSRMWVHFTGGSITRYGSTPAKFTTSNEITQFIIENSKQFKENKIYIEQ